MHDVAATVDALKMVSRGSWRADMARKYFGTDGIRGRVGEAADHAGFLSAARLGGRSGLRAQWAPSDPDRQGHADLRLHVRVGARGRTRRPPACDVTLLGPMPTPAVAYLTRTLRADAGIVISASHNPFYDNGIKFFDWDGNKLPDEKELEIEAELDSPMTCVTSEADRQGQADRDARGSLHRILQGDGRSRHAAARLQDRARLRPRCDLRRGAGCLRGTRRRRHRDWCGARWPEHQRRLRLDASGAAAERSAGATAPIWVSPSTATATAC